PEKERAEEHHLGGQKHPHSGGRGLALLLEIFVLIFQTVAHEDRVLEHSPFAVAEQGVFRAHFALFPSDIRRAGGPRPATGRSFPAAAATRFAIPARWRATGLSPRICRGGASTRNIPAAADSPPTGSKRPPWKA